MGDLSEELAERDHLVEALVEHLFRMGGVARAEIPVSHVDADGVLSLWKVTIERVGKLEIRPWRSSSMGRAGAFEAPGCRVGTCLRCRVQTVCTLYMH